MARTLVTAGIARNIIESESSYIRFEKLCLSLYCKIDNHEYVCTSLSHDRGRDGRGPLTSRGKDTPVLCASLRVDFLKKAEEDAIALYSHQKPSRVSSI
jgi:hypothetical protein